MKSPKPPQPTDPKVSSSADQAAQTGTAIAQTMLGNPQRYTPYGTQRFNKIGVDYTTDAQGKKIEVPLYEEVITFSPEEQRNYDYENQLNWQMGDIALSQLGRLEDRLSQPVNASDLMPQRDFDWNKGGDYEGYRQRELDNMRRYLSPELDRQQQAFQTQLANQGIAPGSEAYREAMALQNRQRSDADLQMYMNAGQGIDRAFGMDRDVLSTNETLRERELQERSWERNQPLNEISALTSGMQVNSPQFAQFQPGTIRPTDVAGQYNHYDQMRMQAWQAQQQQRSAMMSGLFGLGSSVIGGVFGLSDLRFKTDIVKLTDDPRGFGWYSYRWKDTGEMDVGVIAQEVAEVLPHAVREIGGALHVNYGAL